MTCQPSPSLNRLSTRRASRRAGFTLVEILVVIAIIGILVSMLAVAIFPVLIRGQEATVQWEVQQIGQALESFKTKYGFYPPSGERFERDGGTAGNLPTLALEANQILPYLNKMAPNHRETELSPVASRAASGFRRIDDWWLAVGSKLNQQTSMIFWLSGLAESTQYPLTGGLPLPATMNTPLDYIPCGFNENINAIDGLPLPALLVRRNSYEFNSGQMIDTDGTGAFAGVARYTGKYGDGEHAIAYRDAASYIPYYMFATTTELPATSYVVDLASFPGYAYHVDDDLTTIAGKSFAAPDTFQIVTIGMDGDVGLPVSGDPRETGAIQSQSTTSEDNLCSFADGRLGAFDIRTIPGY